MVETHGKTAHGKTLATHAIAYDALGSDHVVEQRVDAGGRDRCDDGMELLQL